jgi:hypothetical protein
MKVFQRVQEQSGPCPKRSLNPDFVALFLDSGRATMSGVVTSF